MLERDDGINDCATNYFEGLLYRYCEKGGLSKKMV